MAVRAKLLRRATHAARSNPMMLQYRNHHSKTETAKQKQLILLLFFFPLQPNTNVSHTLHTNLPSDISVLLTIFEFILFQAQ